MEKIMIFLESIIDDPNVVEILQGIGKVKITKSRLASQINVPNLSKYLWELMINRVVRFKSNYYSLSPQVWEMFKLQ